MLPQRLSRELGLIQHRLGTPQQAGALTVLPVFGPDANGKFVPPLSGLKLEGVRGYGTVILRHPGPKGVAIVPLHMGYIQDQAQNHALCRSAFIGAGQALTMDDACCVQQAQGGYLESKEQWFFILPLMLRTEALKLRRQKHFGKLWSAIAGLNTRFGLAQRGHLEQILCGQRSLLTRYQSRFEALPGQTGAFFFQRGRLVGVEIAPSPAYFAEVWMPLVCFCYGAEALYDEEVQPRAQPAPEPLTARTVPELRARLADRRRQALGQVGAMLEAVPHERLDRQEEERFLNLRLCTVQGKHFAGQTVDEDGRLVYASLTATPEWLEN